MITSKRVTVGTEAVQLVPPSANPQKVKFVNAGSEVVRIGGSAAVDPANAYGLARLPDNPNTARNIWEFELNPLEEIWAIVADNTSEVNVWIQSTL
jgi:hypothetical protein